MQEFDVTGRIKELCNSRSWSYYKLAKESGIPYSTLNTMLHKTNAPSIPTIERICQGLGISLSQFFAIENEIAKLSEDQHQCLSVWDTLDQNSKTLALAYMQGIQDRQNLP